ncbi:monofunctional biosynthetic peptidoglycan transglycosylase [Marinobacter sp.]|uniref:monofunctional biosynthetic peptidoglycan transglycosylase n=1 Tax=Marinobacter sp. TaxID=50741 RepID=UPI0034A307C9
MARKSFVGRLVGIVAWFFAGTLTLVVTVIVLLRFLDPPTTAFMVAHKVNHSDGKVIHQWVDYSRMSEWMPLAVVASEDQRFPDHWGVDFAAIRSALADYRAGDGLRGASTITQQTAKNLFLWNGRSFVRKALEAGLALGLEVFWPKQRILEVYLNVAEFGPGIYGVEAASRAYFGIGARDLSSSQAARLAAVLPNPKVLSVGNPSRYVWERAAWVERQMRQLNGPGYLRGME